MAFEDLINKKFLTVGYYIVGFYLVFIGHKIDPTNMAGLGLDIVFYPLVFIWSFILLGKYSYKTIKEGKSFRPFFVIHFIGFLFLMIYVNFF